MTDGIAPTCDSRRYLGESRVPVVAQLMCAEQVLRALLFGTLRKTGGACRSWACLDRNSSRLGHFPVLPRLGRDTADVMIPRVGDVLRISCPQTPTRVTGVGRFYASVRSPWWRIDPDTEQIRWNGDLALSRDRSSQDWQENLLLSVPPADQLREGDRCTLGIPDTVVHVIHAEAFDPPAETGWLPRPYASVGVLRHGVSVDPRAEDQGAWIDLDDAMPVRLALIFRPYSFLEIGDEAADREGRAWRFDGPWDWSPFGSSPRLAPAWPLTLISRGGEADPEAAAAIEQATASGRHQDEVDRWRAHSGADVPSGT